MGFLSGIRRHSRKRGEGREESRHSCRQWIVVG